MHEPLLQLHAVSKSFGAARALDDVSFSVDAGEVVALVGDNGAGKSTLIKVISGNIAPDNAEISFDGRAVQIDSPSAATELGIATVYQDLALCNDLDVVANLFLGRERRSWGFLDELAMEKATGELLAELSVHPRSLRSPIKSLSGGQRQSVAIARCLLGGPRVVLLDEPTSALGLAQKEQVISLIRRLKERGLGIVLISHNLAEVFAVADRIEVLRLGRNTASIPADLTRQEDVVAAITGANLRRTGPNA